MDFKRAIDILDLSHDFTKKELKSKYRTKCLETHPDKNKDESCKQEFLLVKEAYEFLSDEKNTRKEKQDNHEKDTKTRQNTLLGYMLYFFGIFLNLLLHHLRNDSKTIILKPTIHDILLKNIYKLEINSELYYIPLWSDIVYIKQCNITVKIEIPENMHYKYEPVEESDQLFYKHICLKREVFDSVTQNMDSFDNSSRENTQKLINSGIPPIKKVFDYDEDIVYMFHNMNTYSDIELL